MKFISHFAFLALAIAVSGAIIPQDVNINGIAKREVEAMPVAAAADTSANTYQVRDTDTEEHKKKHHHHKKPSEARDVDEEEHKKKHHHHKKPSEARDVDEDEKHHHHHHHHHKKPKDE
ncbi:hypothetical protein EG329_000887 [Mollisiaceae sp. DMI_Dod_QoI]|nr:hypothetical protein EG329_000887 [Helotiales sp. DMI_Dod_QoI]